MQFLFLESRRPDAVHRLRVLTTSSDTYSSAVFLIAVALPDAG